MAGSELDDLFVRLDAGDTTAADELVLRLYDELRAMASARLADERAAHTLQPTALVHEAWLRLGGDRQPVWKSRRHFIAAASEAMRRILIDKARSRLTARRGGGAELMRLDVTGFEVGLVDAADDERLLTLNELLEVLQQHDPRRAELVKHRYFVGLTFEETAEVMGLSVRTVKRDWVYARAWLLDQMNPNSDSH